MEICLKVWKFCWTFQVNLWRQKKGRQITNFLRYRRLLAGNWSMRREIWLVTATKNIIIIIIIKNSININVNISIMPSSTSTSTPCSRHQHHHHHYHIPRSEHPFLQHFFMALLLAPSIESIIHLRDPFSSRFSYVVFLIFPSCLSLLIVWWHLL